MKKGIFFTVLILISGSVFSQQIIPLRYSKTSAMIPMRDGVQLYTVILTPIDNSQNYPFLIRRTPYSADSGMPSENGTVSLTDAFSYADMAADGYIFIFQDIRGKFKSQGSMEIHQPIIHLKQPGTVDESTDTWDTIEWLLHHVPHNNGKAGITGISYPGWLALVGAVNPHPALKASSEQACMGDLFLGDDFHHNGAFRLSYGLEYTYGVEGGRDRNTFPFPQFDVFDWYLKLGSLKNVNQEYFHNRIPTWDHFVNHPDYDNFWQKNSTLSYVSYPEIPQLHVGGYYDQEDINGPQLMYGQMEKKDSFNRNHIVLGPWYHGQWGSLKGDSIGKISFGSNTGDWFRVLQKKWFDYYLKDIGDGKFDEAYAFQTGTNEWKTYTSWPPKEATVQHLYAGPDHKAGFIKPKTNKGSIHFVSDPEKPVPYRELPIEATYGSGSRWRFWHVEDQRFVSTRPDVISFSTDSLKEDLIVTGAITAHLFASTSGTDADWVVKLIDVYPAWDSANYLMSGYQLPVAMEVFRGRYRKSFSKPEALVPNKPEEFVFGLHEVNHVFKKGHRLMMQVQSSWFPVIDRNPQKFVPNIYKANNSDFIKATQTIYFSKQYPTHIDIPVMVSVE
jgi:putative CocE/NonD family hydrolase